MYAFINFQCCKTLRSVIFSEAVETRHALHGVQWPSSNPKCLNVDFGSESQMERAIASTNEDVKPAINLRDDRSLHPWDRNEGEREKVRTDPLLKQ